MLLLIFSVLIALFPKKLPNRKKSIQQVAGESVEKEAMELQVDVKAEKFEKPQLKGIISSAIREFAKLHFLMSFARFSCCNVAFVIE